MEDKKRWDLLSIASIPLVITLGNSMIIPVLPIIENRLDISSLRVSMIITVYSVVAIFVIPLAGFLSDRYGRKKIILPSLFITAIGGLIAAFASWKMENPYLMILIGRFFQGIGASGAFPIVLPLIGDIFRTDEEISSSLGIIETSNTFGKVLSPIVGAYLASFAWFLPFFAIPVFSISSLILVFFLVKSSKKDQKPKTFKDFIESIKKIFSNNGKWLYSVFIIGGIIMFVLFGVLFYLSSILESKYHIEGVKKGLVLAVPLLSLSISSFVTGKKIGQNKRVMKWVIVVGSTLLSSSLILIIFFKSIYIMLGLLVFGGIGIGISLPSMDALITEGIEKEERGTITSLYSSSRFVGIAIGPPLVAVLMKYSHSLLFIVETSISILSILLTLFLIRPSKGDMKQKAK